MQMLTSVVFTDKNHCTNEQIVFMFLIIYKIYTYVYIFYMYVTTIVKEVMDLKGRFGRRKGNG